jgi:acyl carrier protein
MLSILRRSMGTDLDVTGLPDRFNVLVEGVLDSFGFVELIVELERRLGAPVDLSELDAEDIGSIGPMARYIAEKVQA